MFECIKYYESHCLMLFAPRFINTGNTARHVIFYKKNSRKWGFCVLFFNNLFPDHFISHSLCRPLTLLFPFLSPSF